MAASRYRTLEEFWPFYVREHSQPLTCQLHFIGNTNLLCWLAAALSRRSPTLLAAAVVTSYAWAWIGHFCVERNRPATFEYPVKAAICDLMMYGKMWRGTMNAEVAKYVDAPAAVAQPSHSRANSQDRGAS